MSNNLYDRLAKIDEYRQNRVTLSASILKELSRERDYHIDYGYRCIILHTKKTDSSKSTEEKQKIKRK